MMDGFWLNKDKDSGHCYHRLTSLFLLTALLFYQKEGVLCFWNFVCKHDRHVDASAYWCCLSAAGKFSAFSAYFKIFQRQKQRENLQTVHLYSGKNRLKTVFLYWKTGFDCTGVQFRADRADRADLALIWRWKYLKFAEISLKSAWNQREMPFSANQRELALKNPREKKGCRRHVCMTDH